MINDDIAARIAAKTDRDERPTVGICGDILEPFIEGMSASVCTLPAGHTGWHQNDDTPTRWTRRDETPTLPWLQPATVDPDWLTEARNHSAATREPFTHPLWDVSAA